MSESIPPGSASHWYRTPDEGPVTAGPEDHANRVRAFTRGDSCYHPRAGLWVRAFVRVRGSAFVLSPARNGDNPANRLLFSRSKENVFKENDLKHCNESV
jgi:hypothetical protein